MNLEYLYEDTVCAMIIVNPSAQRHRCATVLNPRHPQFVHRPVIEARQHPFKVKWILICDPTSRQRCVLVQDNVNDLQNPQSTKYAVSKAGNYLHTTDDRVCTL